MNISTNPNKTVPSKIFGWVVVVAQLVERLLPTPGVRGSNPVIGQIYIEHLFTVKGIEKTKKRPEIVPLKNI